jgi:hypothetical protein
MSVVRQMTQTSEASAAKVCCGYTLEYISPSRDPSNAPHYINFLRASSIALLDIIHVISSHKRYNRPGPSFVSS